MNNAQQRVLMEEARKLRSKSALKRKEAERLENQARELEIKAQESQ